MTDESRYEMVRLCSKQSKKEKKRFDVNTKSTSRVWTAHFAVIVIISFYFSKRSLTTYLPENTRLFRLDHYQIQRHGIDVL